MPELSEIIILAGQMRRELVGKTIRAMIEKIKTGSTRSFICPRCQPLDG